MGNSLPGVGKIAKNWRQVLKPEEYAVLREGGTERAFTGEYWDTKTEGVYSCRACGTELFRSAEKFESHCGWPSFFAPLAEDRVRYLEDTTLGMRQRSSYEAQVNGLALPVTEWVTNLYRPGTKPEPDPL